MTTLDKTYKRIVSQIVSLIAAAVIILTLFALYTNLRVGKASASYSVMSRQDVNHLLSQLTTDFHQSGDKNMAIILLDAQESSVTFVVCDQQKITSDTIQYFIGDLTQLSHTPNPMDKILWRKVNSLPPEPFNIGLVNFHCFYADSKYVAVQTRDDVQYIEFTIETEPSFPASGKYERVAYQLNVHI